MSELTNAEQGRLLMAQSTRILDTLAKSTNDKYDNFLNFDDGIGKVSLTYREQRILIARELERRAKIKFNAAKFDKPAAEQE